MAEHFNTEASGLGSACASGGQKPQTDHKKRSSVGYADTAGSSFSDRARLAQKISHSASGIDIPPELVSVLSKLDLKIEAIGNLAFFEVNTLYNSDVEKITKVYIRYMQRLLMHDHSVRDGLPHDINASDIPLEGGWALIRGQSLRRSLREKKTVKPAKGLHSSDALLGILLSCNAVLRQIIVQSLYMCKLAVPWLLPKLQTILQSFPALWPLRGLIATAYQSGDPTVMSMTFAPMHIVSFVRFGEIPFSKSGVLNDLLGIKHPTFYTRECPSGRLKRLISNGTVEAGFRLSYNHPSYNTHIIMFNNLRGDAFDPECSQVLDLLTKMSQSIVLFLDKAHLFDVRRKEILLRVLSNRCNKYLIFFTSGIELEDEAPDNPIERVLEKRNNIEWCFVETNTMLCDIVKPLNDALTQRDKTVSLHNLQDFERDIRRFEGECLDSNFDTTLNTAESLNKELLSNRVTIFLEHLKEKDLGKDVPPSAPKLNLLHMQTGVWPKLASIHREICTSTEKSKLRENEFEIKEKRKQNLLESLRFTPIPNVIHHLISDGAFKTGSKRSLELLLRCYKVFLDDRCHKVIPSLRAEWGRLYHSHRQTSDLESAEKEKLQTLLNACEERMEDESFGVEHLLREMGQFYEALVDPPNSSTHKTCCIEAKQLLEAATSILLLGQPFELIVGDYNVTGIPLVWVRAALEKLASSVGNEKVLVVSILGIQSSGKSTLLNAMFGVQFAVSAGRCTKGVFMQLVKVLDPNLPYKYIVIIDTEGLRANELEGKTEHDNELATFAIGVGDVTIVNVKGENSSEMTDILQIATLAFLRMKNVSSNIELHQRCIFVHQNVSEPNAKEKLMVGRRVLVEQLDGIAREAAIAEGMKGIKQFSDVIQFDLIKDVWYFPDLWVGSPPMAYVNPKYTKHVWEVRHHILEKTKTSGFLRVSELIARISDLWNAILSDDFVFYFRNHLELKSHGELELCYSLILAGVNSTFHAMLNEFEENMLNAGSIENLADAKNESVKIMDGRFQEIKDETELKLRSFCEAHDHKNIVGQWYGTRLSMLSSELEQKLSQSMVLLSNLFDVALLKHGIHQFIYDFEEKMCALAEKIGKRQKSECSTDFDKQADELIGEYETKIPVPGKAQIEAITSSEFVDMFPFKSKRSVQEALEKKHLIDLKYQDLEEKLQRQEVVFDRNDFYQTDDVAESDYLEVTRYCVQLLTEAAAGWTSANSKPIYRHIALYINARVNQLIDAFSKRTDGNHQPIEKLNRAGQAKIHVLQYYCIKDNFKPSSDDATVRAHFASFKSIARNLVVKISTGSNITTTAYILQHAVVEVIQNRVHKELYNAAVVKCSELLCGGKVGLLGEIFTTLAQNDSHEPLYHYITNPKQYALVWMADLFKSKMTEHHKRSFRNIFMMFLGYIFPNSLRREVNLYALSKRHTRRFVEIVRTGLNQTNITGDIKQWVEDLRNYLISHKFVVPVGAFSRVAYIGDSVDCLALQKEVAKNLKEIQTQVKAHFKEKTTKTYDWHGKMPPYEKVLNALWGCEAVCPFCAEPCKLSKGHEAEVPHECIQHKPKGMIGRHLAASKSLSMDTCSHDITTDSTFKCSPHEGRKRCLKCVPSPDKTVYHPYKDYKTYTENWLIQPDISMASDKYWQFMMHKHNAAIAARYEVDPAKLPQSWKDITLDDAISSLTDLYK